MGVRKWDIERLGFQQWFGVGHDNILAMAWWNGVEDKVFWRNHRIVRVFECWEILKFGVPSFAYQGLRCPGCGLRSPYSLVFDCTFSACAFTQPFQLTSWLSGNLPEPQGTPSNDNSPVVLFHMPQDLLSPDSWIFSLCRSLSSSPEHAVRMWTHLFAHSERKGTSQLERLCILRLFRRYWFPKLFYKHHFFYPSHYPRKLN